jgi:hypothetical protein
MHGRYMPVRSPTSEGVKQRIDTRVLAYIRTRLYDVHMRTCVCVRAYMCVCVRVYMCTCVCVHVCTRGAMSACARVFATT